MPPVSPCPEQNAYQRLIHGELPPSEAESLSQHLAGCPSCAAAVQTLLGQDTLLSAIDGISADALTGDEVPADLTRRLLALPARSCAPSPTLPALNPPQGPDEIGRLAHYRVLKVLGEGGMGVVFLAEDTRLSRTVALKTMKPDVAADPRHRQRFLREARAAAKVEHDHIVPIYDVGEERGVPWLAMPFLKGHSLDGLLKRVNVLEPAQAARLGAQVAKGLAAAHAAGLIHRDIKPANIWVEPGSGGRTKLLDFGLARDQTPPRGPGHEHLTHSGAVVGTPAFMAPEQARGEALDARADLFSLGCVLYRAVTGRLPFRGQGTMGTLLALATEMPPAPCEVNPEVPRPLSALIMNLLAKDRSARPASAAAVAAALEVIPEKPTCPVPVAVPAAPQRKERNAWAGLTEVEERPALGRAPRRRRRLAAAAALLALGGALAAGIIVIIKNKDGKEVARVTVPDGGSAEIKQDGGGKPKGDPADPALDRRAAEWVLSIGGRISIRQERQEREIQAANDLPAGPVDLVSVNLDENSKVDDAGLAHFKGLTRLRAISLPRTSAGDAGLEHLKGLTQLTALFLGGTRVSDAGLEHLKGLTNLIVLWLDETSVSDGGLEHLKGLTKLTDLGLRSTRVSDAGLEHLKGLTKLTDINLENTSVTDAGMAHLKPLSRLTWLNLVGTSVGDAGLEHLRGLTKLSTLDLGGARVGDAGMVHLEGLTDLTELWLTATRVGDAGLKHLKGLTKLRFVHLNDTRVSDDGLKHLTGLSRLEQLDLTDTQVTADGVAVLQKALPKCKIVSGPAK